MAKRPTKQTPPTEIKAKLRLWRDNKWDNATAKEKLGTARKTLSDWRAKYWDTTDQPDPPPAPYRGGRKYRLDSYELAVLDYHDKCLREDGKVDPPDPRMFCEKIPEFALKNNKSQWTWVYRFIKRYKPNPDGTTARGDVQDTSHEETLMTEVLPTPETPQDIPSILTNESVSVVGGNTIVPPETVDAPVGTDMVESDGPPVCEDSLGVENMLEKGSRASDDDCELVGSTGGGRKVRKRVDPNAAILTLKYQLTPAVEIAIPIYREDLDSLSEHEWVSSSMMDYLIYKTFNPVPGLIRVFGSSVYQDIKCGFHEQSGGPGTLDWDGYLFALAPVISDKNRSLAIVERPLQPGTTILYHVNSNTAHHEPDEVFKELRWFFEIEKQDYAPDVQKARYLHFAFATKPQKTNEQDCGIYVLHYIASVVNYVIDHKPKTLTDVALKIVAGKFNASNASRW